MTLKPYLKNELFEGIVGRDEYLLMYNEDVLEKQGTVLIAIHDPTNLEHPEQKISGFDDVLQIAFWDVEDAIGQYTPLTNEQGLEIFKFINKNRNKRFMIHCAAGVSRSAGAGMAVECIVNFNGDVYAYKTGVSAIKEHERYSPNLVVFDTIMKGVE